MDPAFVQAGGLEGALNKRGRAVFVQARAVFVRGSAVFVQWRAVLVQGRVG